jgi:hypothetical protein
MSQSTVPEARQRQRPNQAQALRHRLRRRAIRRAQANSTTQIAFAHQLVTGRSIGSAVAKAALRRTLRVPLRALAAATQRKVSMMAMTVVSVFCNSAPMATHPIRSHANARHRLQRQRQTIAGPVAVEAVPVAVVVLVAQNTGGFIMNRTTAGPTSKLADRTRVVGEVSNFALDSFY